MEYTCQDLNVLAEENKNLQIRHLIVAVMSENAPLLLLLQYGTMTIAFFILCLFSYETV